MRIPVTQGLKAHATAPAKPVVFLLLFGVLLTLTVSVWAGDAAASPAPSEDQPSIPAINLSEPLQHFRVHHAEDGQLVVTFDEVDGQPTVNADVFLEHLAQQQTNTQDGGFIYRLLDITSAFGLIWVGLGFGGQALFTGRMIVQWLVSEKNRRSTVPTIFWWMSLCGGAMLLIYFIWRKDIVGVVGQSTGVFIYMRNLALIFQNKQETQPKTAARSVAASALEAENVSGEPVTVSVRS